MFEEFSFLEKQPELEQRLKKFQPKQNEGEDYLRGAPLITLVLITKDKLQLSLSAKEILNMVKSVEKIAARIEDGSILTELKTPCELRPQTEDPVIYLQYKGEQILPFTPVKIFLGKVISTYYPDIRLRTCLLGEIEEWGNFLPNTQKNTEVTDFFPFPDQPSLIPLPKKFRTSLPGISH